MADYSRERWRVCKRFLEMRSSWLTLIGENLQDDRGDILEYWRIEKSDSVIIITLQKNQLILPQPMYRPGVGEFTFDFPGGRVPDGESPLAVVPLILKRELGIEADSIVEITPLNTKGWAVNSSFSNQKLFGFFVQIKPSLVLSPEYVGATYPANDSGVGDLLEVLTCLQCRALLLEWWVGR
ncbi:MAG TPA: NUDIX hydrolase [Leptolyngbyaceae cyanobacterium]